MRIGEAQQIYPEIWQHLDEARKVFADRGTDVSKFDAIRLQEGQGLGADVGLEQKSYGYGSRGVDQQTKTAGFNTQGLARARQACKALMDATPEIDWKAIAAAEGSNPAAADFARSTRNKRYIRLAALALLIFAPFGIVMYMRHQKRVKMEEYRQQYEAPPPEPVKTEPLADADRVAIMKLVADLRPLLQVAKESWPQVVAPQALGAIKPGTAPCSRVMQPPTQAAMDAYVRNGDGDPSFTSSDFYGYPAGTPIPDFVVANALQTVKGIGDRYVKNRATHFDRATLEAIPSTIAIVLIDKETQPEITGRGKKLTYTPGEVLGRAYVYSIRDAKMVCMGMIDAKNAAPDASPYLDAVRADQDPIGPLHREMEIRIREALVASLRAI